MSISYQRNVQRRDNYHDVMLKSFQPFMHGIQLTAVLVFAYRRLDACRKKDNEKGNEELENNIPGQREHPSEK